MLRNTGTDSIYSLAWTLTTNAGLGPAFVRESVASRGQTRLLQCIYKMHAISPIVLYEL